MLLIARTSLSGKGMGRAAEELERDRALQRVAAELYCSSRSFKLSMGWNVEANAWEWKHHRKSIYTPKSL